MDSKQFREKVLEFYSTKAVDFIESFVKIECPGNDELIQPFKLWDAQKKTANEILGNQLNVILKARQLGFTWLVLALSAWALLTKKGFRIGAISRSEAEAMELVRRLDVIFSNMGMLIQPEKNCADGWHGPVYRKTALSIVIENGTATSEFRAFPANANAGRGFTFNWLVLDEWAFHQFADEIYRSLFPTANHSGAKIIGLSTPAKGTLYEEIYTSPDNGYHKIFVPWYADPSRDKKWYETTLRAMGPERTMQEYPATEEEAWMTAGGQMFPEVKRDTHIATDPSFWKGNIDRYVAIDYGFDMFSCHWIAVNEKGKARVYREYDAPNLTIPAACDAFRSLNGDDKIRMILAPSDLWSREQTSGKPRSLIFQEHGMNLVKVSRDFEAGVAAMKVWLQPDADGPALQIEDAPNLFRCLQKILQDPKRPDVYAKQPHELTHDVDSLRYFCTYYISPAKARAQERKRIWTQDMLEDYQNGSREIRKIMEERFGKPW